MSQQVVVTPEDEARARDTQRERELIASIGVAFEPSLELMQRATPTVRKLLRAYIATVRREQQQRDAAIAREHHSVIICDGENETVEQKICNAHADGRVVGYNEAVAVIAEAIEGGGR